MPLSCRSGESEIRAFELDESAWEDLRRSNARDHHLSSPCCGSKVVLKKSRLGTRFFAHARKGDCTSGPETAEHLFVKARIAQAVSGTQWRAATEVLGRTPDGKEWVADVLATRGETKIAFEVQWSPQDHATSEQRQRALRESKVRGLWLFHRPGDIQVSSSVPSVLLDIRLDEESAVVRLPAGPLPTYAHDHVLRKEPYHWSQTIELGRFVRGCLHGAFKWSPGLNQVVPLDLYAAEAPCWKCRQRTAVVTELVFRVDRLTSGARPLSLKVEDFDSPEGEACLKAALSVTDLRSHGIGSIRRRFSRTRGTSYLSNGCVHCDALQGAFFEHEIWHEAVATLTVECLMAEDLFRGDYVDKPYRWCFDESFEASEAPMTG